MVTDIERRKAAENLRAMDIDSFSSYSEEAEAVEKALGIWEDYDVNIWLYIADLIDPPRGCPCYDSAEHRCSFHDAPAVDRDALLALADEMDAYTKCDDERCGREMPPRVIHGFARRIREALGVTVGGRL